MKTLRFAPALKFRPLRWTAALLLIAAAGQATFLLTGCGSKSGETASTSTPAATPEASAPAPDTSAAAGGGSGDLARGEAIFKERCVLCHGPSGHGDGTASKALKPPPRNFHDQAYMSSRTDEQLLDVIHNGKGAMPAWGKTGVLKDDEIRAVLAYVRSLASQP